MGEQRHAEDRLDSLLAEDRVEDVRAIDVVENHRYPLGGDAAGEAAADGNPDAAFDFFLDADGGSRDKLIGLLVQQEDGARVGPEDLPDPRQEHAEEIVELGMRERDVRHDLQALEPVARRSLDLEQARMRDRNGCSIRGELQELDLVLVERARRQSPDVQHADDVALDEQRHPAERLDSLLAQDRVEDVGMVDVVQDDGPARGRDATGETLPQRDPDPAFDLLLDADGGARHELAPFLVEQQDRACVGLQERGRPLEQCLQELLEIEVNERRVRQRLETL